MDRRRSKENKKAAALKMAEILLGGKKLTDLKVTELKSELDKRGLPKRGVKSILIERLKKAILEEELTQVGPVEVTEEDTEAEDSQLETSTLDTSQISEDGFVSPTEASSEADLPHVLTTEDSRPEAAQETQEEGVKAEVVREEVPSPDIDVEGVTPGSPKKAGIEVEIAAQNDSENIDVLELAPLAGEDGTAAEEQQIPQEEVELPRVETPVRDEVALSGDHSNEPMELGTPIGSNSEFDLKFDDPAQDQSANDSGVKIEPEIAEIEGEDSVKTSSLDLPEAKAEENGDEKRDDVTSPGAKSGRPMERLDSSIDPSYQPDSEVLLYEGDPEHEPEVKTEATVGGGEDDDFIVDLHDRSMDIDEGTKAQVKQKLASEGAGGASELKASEKDQEQSTAGSEARRKPGETIRPQQCFLWVSGLAGAVRALDLQTLFSPFGQVISAKVVAKAHSRNHRFGYVTMATPEQAQRCIDELNGSELKGKKITVEVAKSQPPISQPDKSGKEKPTGSPRLGGTRGKEEGGGAEKREDKKEDGTSREKGGDKSPEKNRRPATADKRDGGSSNLRSRDHKPQRRSRSHSRERRGRSPPTRGGRVPRRRSRSRSPPRSAHRGAGAVPPLRDARHDIMRREAERRELQRREMERRMGGDPYLRERERQVEIRLEERRLVHDRHQELLIRRRLEMEHSRREQEILRRVQESREREARERGLRERQLAEQERVFKERERELREREYRERQHREALEREIRERETRERELKERERRIREQHERELRESVAKAQREREMRERELRAQAERERVLREREHQLQEEQERVRRVHEEQQRRTREEQERRAKEREEHERRERERRLREEKDLELKRERERQERERRERAEEDRAKQDQKRKELALQQQRLGKRPFPESSPYEGAKRPAVHDVRGSTSSDGYSSPSSVFRRLDQPSQSSRGDALSIVPRNEEPLGGGTSYRRGEADLSQAYERSRTGGHASGGGGGGGSGAGFGRSNFAPVGTSRERHSDGVAYPLQTISTQRTTSQRSPAHAHAQRVPPGGGVASQSTANMYSKMAGEYAGNRGSAGIAPGVKSRPAPADPVALSRIAPEIFTRATEALENIRKTVASAGGLPLPPSGRINPQARIGHQLTAAHLQQLATVAASHAQHVNAANYMSMNPRLSLSGAGMPAASLRQPVIPGLGAGMVGGGGKPHPHPHPHGGAGMLGKPQPHGQGKLPPEGERYNRRLSRPQGHQQRQTSYKRLI